MSATARRTKVLLLFVTVYVVWGSSYLATKIGVRELPPFLFAAVRFVSAGTILFFVAHWRAKRNGLVIPSLRQIRWRHPLITAITTVLIANGGNVWALQYLPSNVVALLNISSTFFIVLLGTLGPRGHAVARTVAMGLLIGLGGTLLIALPQQPSAPLATASATVLPMLAVILACLGWSAGTIYVRNADLGMDLVSFTGLQLFCGGLMMLIPALIGDEPARWHWSMTGFVALAYMTIMSSCIAYTAYLWLSVHTTPAQVSTYGFVNPLIATVLGWLILGEQLSVLQVVGIAVVLAGVLLVNWPQPTKDGYDPG